MFKQGDLFEVRSAKNNSIAITSTFFDILPGLITYRAHTEA